MGTIMAEFRIERVLLDTFDWIGRPVVALRPDRCIVGANRAFLDKYGFKPEDLIGKKCYQIFFSLDNPCQEDVCIMEKLLTQKEMASRVKETVAQNGSRHYQEINCLPFQGADGQVIFIIAEFTDVTRSKIVEADLRKTKEFLEKIIENTGKSIVAADMKGMVLLMNNSAKQLFKYPDSGMARRISATDVYAPEVAKDIMAKLRSPYYGGVGKLDYIEIEVISSTGENIPVAMTASIIYEDGREIATMAIFEDLRPRIEEEKREEKTTRQLMQSEKLVSIGRLAAGVAHEINNPLGGIVMYSHLAMEDLPSSSLSFQHLKKVVTQAERCKRIVKGLLDFSRHREPNLEQVNANDMLEEILRLVEGHTLFQGIEITRRLDPSLPLVKGDRSQLLQVFMNLAVNAAEAMESGGGLTIETTTSDSYVVIRFADTGCGIQPEHQEEVFEPFFTTKAHQNGTGLGLSVSHGIVTAHGGTITFDSQVGEGTTFVVTLPLNQEVIS